MINNNLKNTMNKINVQKNISFYNNMNLQKGMQSSQVSQNQKGNKIKPEVLWQFSSVLKRNNFK